VTAGAYVNTDPRFIPDFDPITGLATGDYQGWDDQTAFSLLVPFLVGKSEPNAESELLRGVHDHQTVYTLEITNNLINATDDIYIEDWLPAGVEFLGCGLADNSASEEYVGSGPINPGNAPAMANPCLVPVLVETILVDPDGPGSLPIDTYTHVRWDDTAGAFTAAFGHDDMAAAEVMHSTTSRPSRSLKTRRRGRAVRLIRRPASSGQTSTTTLVRPPRRR
jgi:hypothetical protein